MANPLTIRLIQSIGVKLPASYMDTMTHGLELVFDFAEGKQLLLWPLDELITINTDYEAVENYPGFFLIGTYGVSEACAIETATGLIYTIPFIGNIPEDAIPVGESMASLLEYLKQPW